MKDPFPLPDDPHDVAEFVRSLRAVKMWAGDPSLELLRRRTGVATSTLSDAFNPRRRRMPSLELVRMIVRACGADPSQAAIWERAWRVLRERLDAAESPAAPLSGLHADRGSEASPERDAWVPRQLPSDVSGFIGRVDALATLAGRSGQVTTTVITGTAGVGKTALAVHWAHQISRQYRDGQLYLDLRGHAGDPAITPTEALSLLLQSLGVSGDQLPVDLSLLQGMYRSRLAGRRVLVVLDNVVDAAHVRPLLPGGPDCHALVTSRDALTGLMVREGALQITLDTLTVVESTELLIAHLGAHRVAAEPQATTELTALCAHLPLALRITAANLAVRRHQSIAGTVRELQGTDRLGRLQVVGDPESAVAAAFDTSYRFLPESAQQLFRLFGLVPGPEVDRPAAAVLLDRDPADLVPELDELIAAHLVFESSPGRYRMHDLLSLYARRHAGDEPASIREDALHRLLSWYVLNTDAAAVILRPFALEDRAELGLVGTAPGFSGPAEAVAWLRAELPNLTRAVMHAADEGPTAFAWHLAYGLTGFLYSRASGIEHLMIARAALRAAERADHALGQARGHASLAMAAVNLGDLHTAIEEFEIARQQYTLIDDTRGILAALGSVGDICVRLGDIDRAIHYFQEALALYPWNASAGEPLIGSISNMANLAMAERIRGNQAEALDIGSECLVLAEQVGPAVFIVMAKIGLAMTYLSLGDLVAAETLLLEAHSAAVERDSDIEAYDALAGLVLVCARTGRVREALAWAVPLRGLVERGVTSEAGDDWGSAAILETYLAAGQFDDAVTMGEPVLAEYDRAGRRLTAMRVRVLLGRVHAVLGNDSGAKEYWESVLPYVNEQSLPDRAVIDELLTELH
jgi:tetratricopeptide (TPR) repeat protein